MTFWRESGNREYCESHWCDGHPRGATANQLK